MMRLCALALLLAAVAHAEKPQWSQLIREANVRSDWIPVSAPRDLDTAAQEEVSTILRPPSEPGFIRQTRLIQPPRQERTNFGPPPQPFFAGDTSHLVRFPGQQGVPLRGAPLPPPNGPPPPNFLPNFRPPQSQPPPGFLQQLPTPQQQQQPQQFNQQPIPLRPQNQSFVPAGPQDEVQLVYVPIEALPPFQKPSNNVPVKQRAPQPLPPPGQFGRQPQPPALPFGNQQQQFDQEQLRIARLKEQEERQRIQEQELRERQEQEKRIRQEAEQKQRQQQQQQQQFRPPQNLGPNPNLKTQENIFQQRFPQTTELPLNPAPHQPPLAVYVTAGRPQKLTVDDVIESLKGATTIPVLDALPDTKSPPPQIFVGPAEMTAPNGYSKFDLPYLNSIDSNRVERKVEQLPFFVAPLSYSPPQGYNKIPFPAPHIGSVVVAPGSRHFNSRPASPDPAPQQEEFNFNDGAQISPAIPLLVNSLQTGGQRQKFQHQPQQQQQTFAPPPPPPVQRFPPPPQHPQHVQPAQPQFIYRDEQTFGHSPPPPQLPFVRQHHRPQQQPQIEQFHRQEVTPAHHFAPPQQPQFIQESVQPQFFPNNQFQFTQEQEEIPEEPQVENEVVTEAPTTTTTTTTTTPAPQRPVTRVRARPQAVSTTASPRTRAPSRNSDENVERRPVNRGRRPVHRERTTTPEPEVEDQPEQQFADVQRENSVRHEEIPAPNYPLPPSQLSPFTNQQHFAQIPIRQQQFDAKPQFPAFQGQFEHNFRSLPAPLPQVGVTYTNNGSPDNHRAVFSNEQSPSTIDYPTASPSLAPQLSLKGEIGQVQHSPSPTPFAPTPLPQEFTPQTFTASPSFAPAFETEEPTTPESVPEVPSTEEPQRTRQRVPVAENVAVQSTPRPRSRVTAEGQRFRARPTATREENQDESAPRQTPQRTRGRQVVRVRTTTESPAAEGENYPEGEVTRPRNRFRAIERTRVGARQQQVVRGRQPVGQQQEDIELAKPVRHGPSTEKVINDSPVFVADNENEAEVSTEKSTTEAATTQKPGRRFNNFGVGQRTRRIRPVANQEQGDKEATTVAPSRSFATARPSRRQSTVAPIARSTLRGGARLRRPTSTTEAPESDETAAAVETGVTYTKNPYVSIQRGEKAAEEVSNEEVAAPVLPQKAVKSSKFEHAPRQQENYPPNFNFDDAQSDTVVYRPRVRVSARNRYHQQEDPEFNVEESQRSEQISVQQLDDAVNILKSYYNTKYTEEDPSEIEEIDFTEEPSTEPASETSEISFVPVTDQKVEAATTEPVPTTIAEEVSEVSTSPTVEPKVEKFSSKIKVSEPKRRIRIKKRPVGDVFETAESQNIASAKNLFGKSNEKDEKKIEESKVSVADVKGPKVQESSDHNTENVQFTSTTTSTTTTTTEAPVSTTSEAAETVTARSATETTVSFPEELTTLESTATTTGDEEMTTESLRIIGTSTTTEISLETEICYKGRCIKTKVDADQVPIE